MLRGGSLGVIDIECTGRRMEDSCLLARIGGSENCSTAEKQDLNGLGCEDVVALTGNVVMSECKGDLNESAL